MSSLPLKHFHIPHKVIIKNKSACLTFLKRNYKYVHALKMEYVPLMQRRSCQLKIMKRFLMKIAKKHKHMYSLCLQEYIFCGQNFQQNEINDIIKRFTKIRSLSLPLLRSPLGQLKSNIIWLNQLKYLKSFRCIPESLIFWFISLPKIDKLYKKFMVAIQRKKLEALELHMKKDYTRDLNAPLMLSQLPSTLKSLNFTWENPKTPLIDGKASQFKALLANMTQLNRLSLYLPVPFNKINTVLTSIPVPSNLLSIDLVIHNGVVNNPEEFHEFGNTLKLFTSLQRISLKFDSLPNDLSNLGALAQCPLKQFHIEALVEDQEDLKSLVNLIGSLKDLEILCLKLTWAVFCEQSEHFISLFNQIGSLHKVQRLEIYSLLSENKKQSCLKIFPQFCKCLGNLPNLTKLFFTIAQANISEDFGGFLDLIKIKKNKLQKLEINLGGQRYKNEELLSLLHIFQEGTSLQTLAIDEMNLKAENEDYYLDTFAKAICKIKKLEALRLEDMNGSAAIKPFTTMIETILCKSGLKEFHCTTSSNFWLFSPFHHLINLNMEEILLKNPALEYVVVPKGIQSTLVNGKIYKWS